MRVSSGIFCLHLSLSSYEHHMVDFNWWALVPVLSAAHLKMSLDRPDLAGSVPEAYCKGYVAGDLQISLGEDCS